MKLQHSLVGSEVVVRNQSSTPTYSFILLDVYIFLFSALAWCYELEMVSELDGEECRSTGFDYMKSAIVGIYTVFSLGC